MNYPIPFEICEYFLFTTTFIFISGVILFYNKDYITAFLVFSLVFTSINFWRNPRYDIRRSIDMTMCNILGIFLLLVSVCFEEFNRVLYDCVVIVLHVFTLIENILWAFDNNQWVIFHLAIHIYTAYFLIFIYYFL